MAVLLSIVGCEGGDGEADTANGFIDVDEENGVFDDDFIADLDPEPECDLRLDTSTVAELPAGTVGRFGPCEINDATGELLLVNEQTALSSTSLVP